MMLRGAAKTLVENTTQIHPTSLTREAPPLASKCVKRTITQNPPKFNNRINLNVDICIRTVQSYINKNLIMRELRKRQGERERDI